MKKYLPLLTRTQLFAGIRAEDISAMLDCLGASMRSYEKGGMVFHSGMFLHSVALLAEGRLLIQKTDYWGNLNILAELRPGQMFGAAYTVPSSGALLNDVTAAENSVVLFFDIERVLSVCSATCPFHAQLIKNLFYAMSGKSRELVQKLDYLSKRSTRDKLLAYLSNEAQRQNSSVLTIPFNRQQLADFLSVDRSAMSSELGRMRDEGLLSFRKNTFILNNGRRGDSLVQSPTDA